MKVWWSFWSIQFHIYHIVSISKLIDFCFFFHFQIFTFNLISSHHRDIYHLSFSILFSFSISRAKMLILNFHFHFVIDDQIKRKDLFIINFLLLLLLLLLIFGTINYRHISASLSRFSMGWCWLINSYCFGCLDK